jgi:hypothetical protein
MTKIQSSKHFPLTLTLSPKGEGLSSVAPGLHSNFSGVGLAKEETFSDYCFLSPLGRGAR